MFVRTEKPGGYEYLQVVQTVKIGPPLVFERLWRQRKVKDILEQLLANRK